MLFILPLKGGGAIFPRKGRHSKGQLRTECLKDILKCSVIRGVFLLYLPWFHDAYLRCRLLQVRWGGSTLIWTLGQILVNRLWHSCRLSRKPIQLIRRFVFSIKVHRETPSGKIKVSYWPSAIFQQ